MEMGIFVISHLSVRTAIRYSQSVHGFENCNEALCCVAVHDRFVLRTFFFRITIFMNDSEREGGKEGGREEGGREEGGREGGKKTSFYAKVHVYVFYMVMDCIIVQEVKGLTNKLYVELLCTCSEMGTF